MQVRSILSSPLLLLLGCGSPAPASHTSPHAAADAAARSTAAGSADANVFDSAWLDATVASDASAAPDGRSDRVPESERDAATALDARMTPGLVIDGAVVDACSGDPCTAAGECDDDRPCSATEAVCIANLCKADPAAPPAAFQRSAWSGRAGIVGEDDTTLWCNPVVAAMESPARVTSQFDRVALDATRTARTVAPTATQRVRFLCFADPEHKGSSTVVTSAWATEGGEDVATARCPRERPHAALVQCQLASEGKPPFVYAGKSCGDGVAGVAKPATLHGQLLGDRYELSGPEKPLFNDTRAAAVVGTDLGFSFLAQGRMYIGFGDTWENHSSLPGPNGYRGSVLAYTRDYEPSDANGIAFDGWETSRERPNVAREIIDSPHDQSGNTEFTAIATAGFGLTEASGKYRFLWFAAIKQWDPFLTNESTLAWSKDGGPFTRGDRAQGVRPPRWPFETYFGPGAVWVDRERGYVYFLGVRTYRAGFPIRVARVRATVSAVLDHLQYEYWTGSAWQRPDARDEYGLARATNAAADLIPGGAMQNNRPEFSVVYNPYLSRFMMLVHNDATAFENEARSRLQLWTAEAIEGPWTLANTGEQLTLPPNHYGPYFSEQTLSAGGRNLYFLLTEWNLLPLTLGQPYTVGLWSAELQRKARPGCDF